jgi:hypothetical protein
VPTTAPFGALRIAKEYLLSATLVQKPAVSEVEALRQRISFPGYFLVGHSIELSLKAFLLARGISVSVLRLKPYGHNLESLLKEARRRRLGTMVKLSTQEVTAVNVLNDCYSVKEFEYAVTGVRHLPPYALVHAVAAKLNEGLHAYCFGLAANV